MTAVPYLENLKIFTLGSCRECDSRIPREIKAPVLTMLFVFFGMAFLIFLFC